MKFIVSFSSKGGGTPLFIASRDTGLEGLDKIRRGLDIPGLDHELVAGKMHQLATCCVKIELSEGAAREAGRFGLRNSRQVYVPRRSLNTYAHQVTDAGRDPTTGAVLSAWIGHTLDEGAIVADWLAAGAPREWTPQRRLEWET